MDGGEIEACEKRRENKNEFIRINRYCHPQQRIFSYYNLNLRLTNV